MRNPRILVIRRDNIGDLVCTTPLLGALRERFPDALIAALVNSYNRDVLDGHPSLDELYAYEKAKHRAPGRSLLDTYLDRWRLFRTLRQAKFDYAILAGLDPQGHSLRLARFAGAARTVGFVESGRTAGVDIALPYGDGQRLHEVQDTFRLLHPFGIVGGPPSLKVVAHREDIERAMRRIATLHAKGPVIALHLSARKPSQRWSADRFVALSNALAERHDCKLVLLWAPGEATNPRHPGDDDKARQVANETSHLQRIAHPTETVRSLAGVLAACDFFIGADGGAMHLAAGLGKPVVALFGDSSPSRWRPWGVNSEVIQTTSRNVCDITEDMVVSAFGRLLERPEI